MYVWIHDHYRPSSPHKLLRSGRYSGVGQHVIDRQFGVACRVLDGALGERLQSSAAKGQLGHHFGSKKDWISPQILENYRYFPNGSEALLTNNRKLMDPVHTRIGLRVVAPPPPYANILHRNFLRFTPHTHMINPHKITYPPDALYLSITALAAAGSSPMTTCEVVPSVAVAALGRRHLGGGGGKNWKIYKIKKPKSKRRKCWWKILA